MSTQQATSTQNGHAAVSTDRFGSDVIADALRALGLQYVALNPGASYRGLHDSIVNHLGNARPKMLVCLHEEHAVGIAHGYAKVSGRLMGAIVHSNVGLMHATMAIFNAWCDRVPVLVLGATGPVDAAQRRPWIDWIHTAQDQGALVRDYTKWDNQPASAAAAVEALSRAAQIACTLPRGPVYVCFDAEVQEAPSREIAMPDPARYAPPVTAAPRPEIIAELARALDSARAPVMLAGRVSRDQTAWKNRVALAERLGMRVFTDMKLAAAFPTDHPLAMGPPATFMSDAARAALGDADVVLSLDWVDLGGALRGAFGERVTAKVASASVDFAIHGGWSMDYQMLPPVDFSLASDPDDVVAALLEALGTAPPKAMPAAAPKPPKRASGGAFNLHDVATVLYETLGDRPAMLLGVQLGWSGDDLRLTGPLDYFGGIGGGGVGGGPGVAVGAALALRDAGEGRLPIALLGDGDFLMGATAIWTAVQEKIPLLVIVGNNRAYFNDVLHQERIAKTRGRPVENRFVGQRIDDPPVDIAALAGSLGARGIGPVSDASAFQAALDEGLQIVTEGGVCVIDALVLPEYDSAMAAGLMRGASD